MTQPLFIQPHVEFQKTAAEVTLPDDPNQWPTEILQELYKQAPYISDFAPDVIMDRVDAEKRFAFGHIEVSNKTEIQESPESPTSQAAGIRHVRIPIIVCEGKLKPFDVLVTDDSKMLPLTERRLRQSLFRPQLFDVTSRTPGDQSMISQLYPPYRQNYGFGGGGAVMSAGMGKEGAEKADGIRALAQGIVPLQKQDNTPGDVTPASEKTSSLLKAILPTIDEGDYQKFAEQMHAPEVKSACIANRAFMASSLETLLGYTGAGSRASWPEKLASAIRPTVLQVSRASMEGGYRVKTASHRLWAPRERYIDRGELVREFGTKLALDVDTEGSVTAGEPSVEADLPEHDQPEIVSSYGVYKVQDSNGRHLIGFVFPNLLDLDGTALPISLFTNGSQATTQGEIVGVRVAEGAAIIEGKPRGHGVFYRVLQNGKAVATIPLDIKNAIQDETGGVSLMASSPLHGGAEVKIVIQPNLKSITQADEQTLLVPDDWAWLPLDNAEDVELVDKPDMFEKYATRANPLLLVEIRAGGPSDFSFSGAPVEKLGYDQRSFLSIDDALFLLVGLGASPTFGIQKLGEAVYSQRPAAFQAAHDLETEESFRAQLEEKRASGPAIPNFRVNLIKEAAFVPDSTAVDTVLSLGFINPENILTFVGYLPYLNEAQEKLCELLIASRLGMRDINEAALERCIRGVEGTLEGLRTLAFQEN